MKGFEYYSPVLLPVVDDDGSPSPLRRGRLALLTGILLLLLRRAASALCRRLDQVDGPRTNLTAQG